MSSIVSYIHFFTWKDVDVKKKIYIYIYNKSYDHERAVKEWDILLPQNDREDTLYCSVLPHTVVLCQCGRQQNNIGYYWNCILLSQNIQKKMVNKQNRFCFNYQITISLTYHSASHQGPNYIHIKLAKLFSNKGRLSVLKYIIC